KGTQTDPKNIGVTLAPAPAPTPTTQTPVRPLPQRTQIDSRFLFESVKDLTQTQLQAFFAQTTTAKNQELLDQDGSLRDYIKVSNSTPKALQRGQGTFQQTQISVINQDTVNAVLSLLGSGSTNPVILNLANKTVPGGGVKSGSQAQEEDLCRRTTLYTSLNNANQKRAYPLGTFEALYSPKVLALQQTAAGSFAVITMAGYRVSAGTVDPADYPGQQNFLAGMLEKVRVIIDTAIANGNTDIILGALGSGAFATNRQTGQRVDHIPADVAKAFAMVLKEAHPITKTPRYQHFKTIQFAILENPQKTHLGDTFKAALGITGSTSALWSPGTTPLVAHPKSTIGTPIPTPASASPTLALDTNFINRNLHKMTGVPFFSNNNYTSEIISSAPWAGSKAPWPARIESYTEEAKKKATMLVSFAHQDSKGLWYTTKVSIKTHRYSVTVQAEAWLKQYGFPKK
ncbi:MAG: TIGR02452 family protein, partial [Alphaproteobacteria bacterium]|nr:TIGR02452 family protein [Alphaproteobacteria bacterium]